MNRTSRLVATTLSLLVCALATADWPTHRGDAGRTGYSASRLPERLAEHWRYRPTQPPHHAWPAPARGSYWQRLEQIAPRVIDDHAFHPVAAGGLIVVASSADDTLRALDASTGAVQWTFTADGPIRYAPTIHGDGVLFGSDDGRVRRLRLRDGSVEWSTRLAPRDRLVSGNGRLISAWPVRTSVVVVEDVAYAFAGLFPSQGVYLAALDAATGEVVQRTEVDASPQGYLLTDSQRLFVPTGRAAPRVFDLASGRQLGQIAGEGGTFAVLAGDRFYAGGGDTGALVASDARSQARLARFEGKQMAAARDAVYLIGSQSVAAIPRDGSRKLLWKTAIENTESIAASENRVVVGAEGGVAVLDRATGDVVQRLPIEGRALGVAIDAQRLLVATDAGDLYAFGKPGGNRPDSVPTVTMAPGEAKPLTSLLAGWPPDGSPKRGYAVVLGASAPDLVGGLLAETELRVVVFDTDPDSIRSLRERFIAEGVYGSRVAAHAVERLDQLPTASGFANVVVVTDPNAVDLHDEMVRVLKKPGGLAWRNTMAAPLNAPNVAGAGRWTHLYGSPNNTAASGDRLVTDDLDLQWFGGPGPSRMVDRHLRAPSPLVEAGVMIIPGENRFVGVDAANGVELWDLEIPGSQRYSIPYDGGYYSLNNGELLVAAADGAWQIDATTGQLLDIVPLRDIVPAERRWGYLAATDDALFGTAMKPEAARTAPSRSLIDTDYRNEQPLVTATTFFRLNRRTNQAAWSRESVILHPTVCVSGERVLFVESNDSRNLDHPTGRIPLREFLQGEPRLVCLRAETGELLWRRLLPGALLEASNILFVQSNGDAVVVLGSLTRDNDTVYRIACLDPADGAIRWEAEHNEGKPGAFTHGEQVHHPVLLKDRLIAEPAIYRLADGVRLAPDGSEAQWRLQRPGHSCGTLSAAESCVFFRATNPTSMRLDGGTPAAGRMRKLAPSRPGCWINIIPADGMVLIPEASASCVCAFSLQTSMAFAPADHREDER